LVAAEPSDVLVLVLALVVLAQVADAHAVPSPLRIKKAASAA
jgi:hypothetical protein